MQRENLLSSWLKNAERKINLFLKRGLTLIPHTHFKTPPIPYFTTTFISDEWLVSITLSQL